MARCDPPRVITSKDVCMHVRTHIRTHTPCMHACAARQGTPRHATPLHGMPRHATACHGTACHGTHATHLCRHTRAGALVVRTNAVAGLREPMALPLRRQSGGGRKLALRGPGVWPYCNGGRIAPGIILARPPMPQHTVSCDACTHTGLATTLHRTCASPAHTPSHAYTHGFVQAAHVAGRARELGACCGQG